MSDPEQTHLPEDCRPIGEMLGRVGDKWTILVMAALGHERVRFRDLHRAVGGISQRMLTVTLRHLERDGMLVRTVYPTIPPRVEYELSERGRSLRVALTPIAEWVMAHREGIDESRQRFDADAPDR